MENILDESLEEPNRGPKLRHGCVTAWLVLMIIANSFSSLANFYLMNTDLMALGTMQNDSKILFIAGGTAGILNVLFAFMLLNWKKNGFYGFIGTAILMVGINMKLGLGINNTIAGLIGVGILYAILQIKEGKYSAWEQLE